MQLSLIHRATLIILVCLLASCHPNSPNPADPTSNTQPIIQDTTSTATEDTTYWATEDSTPKPAPQAATSSLPQSNLDAFLSRPIDIRRFKKDHQSPNSSGGRHPDYLYRPPGEGFWMTYFVFPPFGEHGPVVGVFRMGRKIGDYNEDRDSLLSFFNDRPDAKLRDMDWVGRPLDSIMARLGKPHFADDRLQGYAGPGNAVLILSADKQDRIQWYMWARLAKPVSSMEEVPEQVKQPNGTMGKR